MFSESELVVLHAITLFASLLTLLAASRLPEPLQRRALRENLWALRERRHRMRLLSRVV